MPPSIVRNANLVKTCHLLFIHLIIGFSVAYLFTGSVAIAGGIALIEPLVNAVASSSTKSVESGAHVNFRRQPRRRIAFFCARSVVLNLGPSDVSRAPKSCSNAQRCEDIWGRPERPPAHGALGS